MAGNSARRAAITSTSWVEARISRPRSRARVTCVRDGFNPTGLPDEALDVLLQRHGRSRDGVGHYFEGIARLARDSRDARVTGVVTSNTTVARASEPLLLHRNVAVLLVC
jgi:hypothetical protein